MCMSVYVCMYVHMYIRKMHTNVYICVCACTVHIYIYIYAHTYAYIHTYIQIVQRARPFSNKSIHLESCGTTLFPIQGLASGFMFSHRELFANEEMSIYTYVYVYLYICTYHFFFYTFLLTDLVAKSALCQPKCVKC